MELMISMAILSVIIVLVSQAFWLGQRSWEKGEQVVIRELTLRTVSSFLSKQIRSAFPLVTKDEGGEVVHHFSGDSDSIRFVSSLPIGLQRQGGLFHISYYIEGDTETKGKVLKVRQRSIYQEESIYLEEKSEGIVVLTELLDANWDYFKAGEWRERWSGDEKDELPEAVRLTIHQQNGKEVTTHEIRVPIPVNLEDEEEAR